MADTYYVNTASTGEGDGTTQEITGEHAAWKTIVEINNFYASLNPGDNIYFNRGNTWSEGQALKIRASGSAGGGYITFGAYGTGAKPILINASGSYSTIYGYSSSVQYIHIDNLELRGDTGVAGTGGINFSQDDGGHIWISDCDINTFGSNVSGISFSKIDTYIIEDCTIVDAPHIGIYIKGSELYKICDGLIQNNDVSGSGNSDNISFHDDSSTNNIGNNHIVQDNKFYDGAEDGIDTGFTGTVTGLVFRGNETYNNGNIGISVNGSGAIVEQNYVHDEGKKGIYVSQNASDCEIRYNIVDNCTECCFSTATSAGTPTNINIYNNIFKEGALDTRSIITISSQSTPDGLEFKNNIILAEVQHGVWYVGTNTPTNTNSVWNNNCFYDSGGDTTFFTVDETDYNFTDWKSTWTQDANSIFTDPLMTDPANDNFKLNPHSPCVNAGTDVSLTEDYEGNAVPQGSAPDIGAYEYGELGETIIINPILKIIINPIIIKPIIK